ncbi:MAG: hypothetical protein AAF829_10710 [Pseudomonadota bacterium]
MTTTSRLALFPTLLLLSLGACANNDYRGERLLGSATEHNIQLQSVRDAQSPNKKEIDGGQGNTGAAAVAALRGAQAKPAGSPAQ